MKIRVVQIWGFLMTVLGWIFVACTMAMEGWKITSVGGMGGRSILTVAWYWSSLWRSCFKDSTAVRNCRDFPVLWSVEGSIQIVRGLLMAALSLGLLGFILSLLGMECTFIGGKDQSKYKKIYTGGCCHIISGVLSTAGYAVYAQYVSIETFNPDYTGLKYDLGTPLFLGWVGSAFHMAGGFFHLWSVCKPLCGGEDTVIVRAQPDPEQNKSTTALSKVSVITSKTKLSSISELSSRSERSGVSSISKSERTSKSRRTARSGRSPMTERTARSVGSAGSRSGSGLVSGSQSSLSSRSSLSTLSESRSSSRRSRSRRRHSRRRHSRRSHSRSRSRSRRSRTVSSLSGSSRSETTPFIKNSFI